MKNRRNYYRILHLQPDAPTAVIKASYRALMQEVGMHPDLGGDHERAAWLNEAFATLSDPVRRAEYNRQLRWKTASVVEHPATAPAPAPRPAPTAAASTPPAPTCVFCGGRCSPASDDRPDATCATCGSALCTVSRYQDGKQSRRSLDRLRRDMPMKFRRSASRQQVWTGTTEDISLNGMRFTSSVELACGERLQVECSFCSAVGVVKSARRGSGSLSILWHYGVEFERLRITRDHGGLVSTVA
jgi:curved DNA-binding protein CbpA